MDNLPGATLQTDASDSKPVNRENVRKKMAPPLTDPPKSTSAASAYRAKVSLPPPKGPPTFSLGPSASVQKIRSSIRAPKEPPPEKEHAYSKETDSDTFKAERKEGPRLDLKSSGSRTSILQVLQDTSATLSNSRKQEIENHIRSMPFTSVSNHNCAEEVIVVSKQTYSKQDLSVADAKQCIPVEVLDEIEEIPIISSEDVSDSEPLQSNTFINGEKLEANDLPEIIPSDKTSLEEPDLIPPKVKTPRARKKRSEKTSQNVYEYFDIKDIPILPNELYDFVQRPLIRGSNRILKCFIERNASGQNRLAPIYTLLLEVNSTSGRPIMYARSQVTSRITSHYVISMNKEDLFLTRLLRSKEYIGKLRSSANTMEYTLYDKGDSFDDLDSDLEIDDDVRRNIRAELCVIRYTAAKKSYPRKMEVALPAIDENDCPLDWRPISKDQSMQHQIRSIIAKGGQNVSEYRNFIFLHKRESKYDPLSSCIVDFRSRATCVSVKNFQLVHSEPAQSSLQPEYRTLYPKYVYEDEGTASLPLEHVILQMGKVGKDCFNMDFQYPLSILQAFAICLSRFDSKQR